MERKNNVMSGIGFVGVLQVAFIVLKLCKVISWSWLLVLAPTWIDVLLCILVFAVAYWIIKR